MNVQEFDTALSDLETRVDRLRALYENWFRGYEKMEPGVARKDVERRVYGLRKELPRNTALRFRYHQLYQRYTTLATYWQRTARQIEEGTHRLQLQRLKRRRPEDDDARTIAPRPRRDSDVDGETIAPPSYELNLDETLDVRQLLDDLDLDHVARAIEIQGPHNVVAGPSSLAPAARNPGVSGRFSRPSFGPSAQPGSKPSQPLEGEGEGRPSAPADLRESMRPSQPAQGGRPASPNLEHPSPTGLTAQPARPMQTFAKPGALKVAPLTAPAMLRPSMPTGTAAPAMPTGAAASPRPADSAVTGTLAQPPARPPATPPARPPMPPGSTASPPTGTMARPGTGTMPQPPARPPVPPPPRGATGTMPQPPARPAIPATGTMPQPPARAVGPGTGTIPQPPARPAGAPTGTIPQPPPRPAAPPSAVAATGVPRAPAVQSPSAARAPAAAGPRPAMAATPAAARPAAPPAGAAPASAALPEQRMRRLYDEYAAAKKKNNEGDVRYETLASSIQKMLPDLSKRHQGKQIDFEVVVKDGRVGLRPKAT